MLKQHLFLTGSKQVGKSTLLRRLIDTRQLACAGFETQAFFLGGERRGFTLHGRVDMPPFENDCICCVRMQQRRSVAIPEVFDHNGVAILKASVASASPYILMDELGKLESQAQQFCSAVLAALDSGKRVLGVLQQCDAPLLERIKGRHDVTVLTVTEENRDELYAMLLEQF